MPIFEYRCEDCCTEFEELESFDDRDVPHEQIAFPPDVESLWVGSKR